MTKTRLQAIGELHEAAGELADAWDALVIGVSRNLEGWDDPERRVADARRRVRLATGVANAALDQALAKAGG